MTAESFSLQPLQLAERIIQLLEQGRFSATYKFALLIALMDLCLEKTGEQGVPPSLLTTRELADKVIALYWPQCQPYAPSSTDEARLLSQGGSQKTQAEILRLMVDFKNEAQLNPAASLPLHRARMHAPDAWTRLLDEVEWKLIEMPLPRLQFVGKQEDRFLYDIGWHLESREGGERISIRRREVRAYQQGKSSSFDNRILFKPGVSQQLVQLSGVLRPLIHRQWAMMVAQVNEMEESRLERFLFGMDRIPLQPVQNGLVQLQQKRCFYCQETLRNDVQIDHFIPWARHPDNAIENLVATHAACNHNKRDFLASVEHVAHWRRRLEQEQDALTNLAQKTSWESQQGRVLSVARALYFPLPPQTRLWHARELFVPFERERVQHVLGKEHA